MTTPPKSNVYTRGGDKGTTSLVGGTRVAKNSPRLEAYGTVDELNSWIGMVAASPVFKDAKDPDIVDELVKIQHRLFDIGSALATEETSSWQPEPFPAMALQYLEKLIDKIDSLLPRHNRFIIPGGTMASARAHVARTVARRAERLIITLTDTAAIDPLILPYINRLSDFLFVLARYAVMLEGEKEIFWEKFAENQL